MRPSGDAVLVLNAGSSSARVSVFGGGGQIDRQTCAYEFGVYKPEIGPWTWPA